MQLCCSCFGGGLVEQLNKYARSYHPAGFVQDNAVFGKVGQIQEHSQYSYVKTLLILHSLISGYTESAFKVSPTDI